MGRQCYCRRHESLHNEKDYRPITCLNICYKIITGMVAKYMKVHADRNSIWNKTQLGTCSGKLGKVEQLLEGYTIMN